MAASLAGARSVDDRRRRRLAKADASGGTPTPRRRGKVSDDEKWRGSRLPLRKIISKHRWKILLLGLLLLTPMAGLGVAAFRMDYLTRRAGPAVADLLDPVQNRLGRAWGSFVLLTSSALSVLIFWVRSRSPADFDGRYGVWLWAAAGCFLFSAAVATDAHLAWADTVVYFRWVHFPQLGPENTRILCWFAPAALFGLGLVRLMYLDMRRCWSSVLTLWLAVIAWVGAAFLMSQSKWSVDIPHRELASKGAALLGHVSLVVSLLLHARFVLYETAAPPAGKAKSEGGGFSVLKLFGGLKSAAEPAAEEPAARKKAAKKPARPKRAPARRTKADEADAESEETATESDPADADDSSSDDDFETVPKPASIPANARTSGASQSARHSSQNGGQSGGGHSGGASNGSSHGTSPGGGGRSDRATHSAPAARPTPHVQNESNDDSDDDDEQDGDGRTGGPSPDSLKGLSKRDRRKLQKQWREEQRKAA